MGPRQLKVTPAKQEDCPLIVTIGDSIVSDENLNATDGTLGATYDSGTGIATVNFSADAKIRVGDVVDVVNFADLGYETFGTTVLSAVYVGTFSITYRPAGVPASAGPSLGGTVTQLWQKGAYVGIASWAQFLSGARFKYVSRGVGGSQIGTTITRFDRDVSSLAPSIVLLSIGTNDIYVGDVTVASIKTGLDTLLQKCRNINARLGIITPPPQLGSGSFRSGWTAPKLLKQQQLIAAMKAWGALNNCPVFDSATSSAGTLNYLNPTSATGDYNTGFSIDKVHPSTLGGYAIGKQISNWVKQVCPPRDWLVSSVSDTSNLISGMFVAGGGSATGGGTVGVGWTTTKPAGTSTLTESLAARTIAADGDTCGSNQVLTISAASSGAQVQLTSSNVNASVTAGDELETGMHLQVSGASDLKGLYVYVLTQSSISLNRQQYYFPVATSNAYAIPEDFSGVIDLPALVRGPAGTHGTPLVVTINVVATFGTSGTGAAVIKVGRATLRKKL